MRGNIPAHTRLHSEVASAELLNVINAEITLEHAATAVPVVLRLLGDNGAGTSVRLAPSPTAAEPLIRSRVVEQALDICAAYLAFGPGGAALVRTELLPAVLSLLLDPYEPVHVLRHAEAAHVCRSAMRAGCCSAPHFSASCCPSPTWSSSVRQ